MLLSGRSGGRTAVSGLSRSDRLIRAFYFFFLICYSAVTVSAMLRGPDKLVQVLTGVGAVVCMAVLCCIDRLLCRCEDSLERIYPALLVVFSVCMFLLQMSLALTLRHEEWNDIGAIHQGAIEWLETGSFTEYYGYYYYFPNNLGSMVFLYLCFKGASLLGFTDYYAVSCLVVCVFLISVMVVSLYYRVVVINDPLQGHVLHCKGCCGLVDASYRETVPERFQPQPLADLLIS